MVLNHENVLWPVDISENIDMEIYKNTNEYTNIACF